MKSRTKFLIQLLISIGLIVLLLNIIDLKKVVFLLKGLNIWFFLLLLILITLDRFFMAYKWHLLLKAKELDISYLDSVRVYYLSTFASFFLPTTVGADIFRVYKLHVEKKEGANILSSVIVERMLGFIASALVAVFGVALLIFLLRLEVWALLWYAVIFLVFFSLIFISSFFIHPAPARRGWIHKFFIFEKIAGFYKNYREYKDKRGLLYIFVILSSVEQLAPVLGNYLAAFALGLNIPFMYFLAVIPIVQLLNRIPISLNGIGINEGLLVYFFSILNLDKADGFSIGLVGQIGVLVSVLPAILYISGRRFWKSYGK